jgi:hypothetical protein
MFKSTEKVALQEIGPRFTLKLLWMSSGQDMRPGEAEENIQDGGEIPCTEATDFQWIWKVVFFFYCSSVTTAVLIGATSQFQKGLEANRRTFFL